MSTVPRDPQSKISANASDLLDCFVEGFDDVVYQVAEQIARHRLGLDEKSSEPIEINESDVKEAGAVVIQSLRGQIKQHKIFSDVGQLLDQIEQCCETHTTKVR